MALTGDDRLRGDVIERLMCDFTVDLGQVAARNGVDPSIFADDKARLTALAADGLIDLDGDRITVTPTGRAFVRVVARVFDRRSKEDDGFSRIV